MPNKYSHIVDITSPNLNHCSLLFHEACDAEEYAKRFDQKLYTYQEFDGNGIFSRGYHIVNVLGYTTFPNDWPECIDLELDEYVELFLVPVLDTEIAGLTK